MLSQKIWKYKNHFTIEHLRMAAKYYGLSYSEEELTVVYQFLQNHLDDLLQQNIQVFEEIRPKIHSDLYKRLLDIYIDLKQKYL